MEQAYTIAAMAVRERYAEQLPEDLGILNGIGRGQIVVFSGSFDQAEQVFAQLGIPVVVDPSVR
jgi:hypothetical protein